MIISSDSFTIMVFLMLTALKLAYAQFDDFYDGFDDDLNDDYVIGEPRCPEEFMDFYKKCKGAVIPCADCIQEAEKECNYEKMSANIPRNGSCWDCTTLFSNRCDLATDMCFGYQDCGGSTGGPNKDGKVHCVNFECYYLNS